MGPTLAELWPLLFFVEPICWKYHLAVATVECLCRHVLCQTRTKHVFMSKDIWCVLSFRRNAGNVSGYCDSWTVFKEHVHPLRNQHITIFKCRGYNTKQWISNSLTVCSKTFGQNTFFQQNFLTVLLDA